MDRFTFKESSSGCVDTPGFKAAGVHCDVRGHADDRLDLDILGQARDAGLERANTADDQVDRDASRACFIQLVD